MDGTNFLYVSKPLKDENKKINYGMSQVTKCLRTNIISLKVVKIEIIVFQSEKTIITKK